MARQNESVNFSNISATTSPFILMGGVYAMNVVATGFGTVDLQQLLADGSTYASVLPAAFAANGLKTSLVLPAGQYKVVIATATAVYANITRIPND